MNRKGTAVLAAALALVLLVIPFSGVKESFHVQNVEKIAMVKSIGLDNEAQTVLSFVQSTISESTPSHAQALISAAAQSFAEAEKQAQILADKYLSFSYARHFLIGETTARQGIDACLNFLLASPVLQLSSYLYICEGTAAKMLESISKDSISTDEVLRNLNLAGKQEGYYYPVSILQAVKAREENACFCIPIIGSKQEGTNTAKHTVLVFKGYAVMRGGKIAAVLNREQSRAYNLLTGRLESSVVACESADVKIMRAHLRRQVQMQAGAAAGVTLRLKLENRFSDVRFGSPKNAQFVRRCEREQFEILSREIRSLLSVLRAQQLDCLGLEALAQMQGVRGADTAEQAGLWNIRWSIQQKTLSSFPLN